GIPAELFASHIERHISGDRPGQARQFGPVRLPPDRTGSQITLGLPLQFGWENKGRFVPIGEVEGENMERSILRRRLVLYPDEKHGVVPRRSRSVPTLFTYRDIR